jgi:hypothetical protein
MLYCPVDWPTDGGAPVPHRLTVQHVSGRSLYYCAVFVLSEELIRMPTIVIRLADILTSASDPIDLTALPKDEAEAHVRRIYDSVPEDAQVSVEDDVATIDIPKESAQRAGRAMETHERDSVATIS